MQSTYQPGEWTLLLSRRAIVALPPTAPAPFVATVWERLQQDAGLATVIDALTEQASGSFTDMLPFAAAVLEDGDVRVAVRGDVSVEVDGIVGTERFSGANVTTWSERFVAAATRIHVAAAEGGSATDDLPILGGVIRANAVTALLEESDSEGPAPDAPSESIPVPPTADEIPAQESAHVPPVPPAPPSVVPSAVGVVPGLAATDAAEPDAAEPEADEPEASPESTATPEDVATEAMDTITSVDDIESEGESEVEPAILAEQTDDAVDDSTIVPDDADDDEEDEDDSTPDAFDLLFGDTIHSPTAGGPAGPPPPPPLPAAGGDHDGATISAGEARALRTSADPVAPDAATAIIPTASTGRIRVSSGQVVSLDRTVIIGRRPRSTRASGANLPHLVAVDSPQQDISRSHLEVRPEGDTVVVIDLHTTNGSTLLRPGADPVRLHPGEQTLVLSGDTIDLGDGVTVLFEDLP
ncbi:MAG: FHA domain-containing protein [Actinomycetota bacterium]